MITLALTAVLVLCDDVESLQKAVDKAAALESYAFKSETDIQSPIGAAPNQIPVMEGKYQKDAGMHIKSDKGEVFKKGDRTLVKQGAEDWKDVAQFQPPAPAADAPKRPRGGGAMGGRMMLRNLKAPHEELKELMKGLKDIKKDEKTEKIGDIECQQYGGELTADAMKGSPLGRLLGQFGGGNAEVKGSAKFWVDLQGNVAIYEVITKASVDFMGNAIEFTLTRRAEITDAGKAKVEIPDAVQKLLSAPVKSEDKKE